MPFRKSLLPREGLTADPILSLLNSTALNPFFTLLPILLARYTKKGHNLSILHETAYGRLKKLFYLGLARWVSKALDAGAVNNWTRDRYEWSEEVVLITGGAGGIGGEVVKLLAVKGVRVVVLDVREMEFETPPNVHHYLCDITSPTAISTAAARIRTDIGAPTILILNAGVARGKTILASTPADITFTFAVNTFSHYYLAREFLPSIIRANHGMVVTIASLASYVTVPSMVDYAASKAAALAFHEGLAAELVTRYDAPRVRTVVVNQGYTKTALFEGYKNGSRFLVPSLEVGTVAEEVVRAVLRGRSGQVVVPRFGNVLSALRALPLWYQVGLRKGGDGIMKEWRGRQVVDVERWVEEREKEKEKGESGSTVLVPPARE